MELWVALSLAAAVLQAVRTGLQRHLATSLPNHFVNFARFAFGAPLAVATCAHGSLRTVRNFQRPPCPC